MRRISVFILGLMLVTLSGCAAPRTRLPSVDAAQAQQEAQLQKQLVVEEHLETLKYLQKVTAPILSAGADFCRQRQVEKYGNKTVALEKRMVIPTIGIYFITEDYFGKDFRDAAHQVGVTRAPQVLLVADGYPAANKGILPGDVLSAVNGKAMGTGAEAPREMMASVFDALDKNGNVNLTFQRDTGKTYTANVGGKEICNIPVKLDPSEKVNAYADGQRVVIHRGIMRHTETSDQLAMVIAHELAHNAMSHVEAMTQNQALGGVLGTVLDVLAASQGVNTNGSLGQLGAQASALQYGPQFEAEADYVGLYIMARAGYNYHTAIDFWRRLAIADPRAITINTTHPTSATRFVAMQEVIAEIDAKKAAGAPLLPELR